VSRHDEILLAVGGEDAAEVTPDRSPERFRSLPATQPVGETMGKRKGVIIGG
jgi:hypothetical protein